jgi:hypothetical protein
MLAARAFIALLAFVGLLELLGLLALLALLGLLELLGLLGFLRASHAFTVMDMPSKRISGFGLFLIFDFNKITFHFLLFTFHSSRQVEILRFAQDDIKKARPGSPPIVIPGTK